MQQTKASARYARALFELAQESNCVDTVYSEMNSILEILNTKGDLYRLIKNPTVTKTIKSSIFQKIFSLNTTPLSINFLLMLIEKGREGILPQIIQQYISLMNKDKGVVLVEVISSKPLRESIKEQIKEKMNSLGKIQLKEKTNSTILGGFVINSGDLQYDASITAKIEKIKKVFEL